MGLCHEGCPVRRLQSHADLHAHEPGNVIEAHQHNMDLVAAYGVSAALAFILDSAYQQAYKALS